MACSSSAIWRERLLRRPFLEGRGEEVRDAFQARRVGRRAAADGKDGRDLREAGRFTSQTVRPFGRVDFEMAGTGSGRSAP